MNWFRSLFNNFWDQVLMAGLAVFICASGVASFWLANEYHVNELCVFFGWNSIMIIPLFVKKYRSHLKKPAFIAFLLVWMAVHGIFVVGLMRWVSVLYWPLLLLIEFTAGFLAAKWLFGVMPEEGNVDQW